MLFYLSLNKNSDFFKQKVLEKCTVCLENLEKTEDVVYHPNILSNLSEIVKILKRHPIHNLPEIVKIVKGHPLHRKCFDQWKAVEATCPMCRDSIFDWKKTAFKIGSTIAVGCVFKLVSMIDRTSSLYHPGILFPVMILPPLVLIDILGS